MSITETINGVGSGTIRLRRDTPPDLMLALKGGPGEQGFGGSWVLVTSEYPGPGLDLSRETLGTFSGGSPLGGMLTKIDPSTEGATLQLEGWGAILTSKTGGLDAGYIEDFWDSYGAQGPAWWLERICAVELDPGGPHISHKASAGRWLEPGSLVPYSGYQMAATTGGWRTRLDGLDLAAAVMNFVWWTQLVDGKPSILVEKPYVLFEPGDTTEAWLITNAAMPGRYSDAMFGDSPVTVLGHANFDQDGIEPVRNSTLGIVGDGKTDTTTSRTSLPRGANDWAGRPLQRETLVSVSAGDTTAETWDNVNQAATADLKERGGATRITLDAGLGIEEMPPLGAVICIHDPESGEDWGTWGLDAAYVPSMRIGSQIIASYGRHRCIERTTPITAEMGVWFIDMRPGQDQKVTDLTPYIVPETGQPTITAGTVPKRDIRQEILGSARGVTIIAN